MSYASGSAAGLSSSLLSSGSSGSGGNTLCVACPISTVGNSLTSPDCGPLEFEGKNLYPQPIMMTPVTPDKKSPVSTAADLKTKIVDQLKGSLSDDAGSSSGSAVGVGARVVGDVVASQISSSDVEDSVDVVYCSSLFRPTTSGYGLPAPASAKVIDSFPALIDGGCHIVANATEKTVSRFAEMFPGVIFNCYYSIAPFVMSARPEVWEILDSFLPLSGPIVARDFGLLLSYLVFAFDLSSMSLPHLTETVIQGHKFLHFDSARMTSVLFVVARLITFDGFIGAGAIGGVNPQSMIEVAAQVGATTIAANDASIIYRGTSNALVPVTTILSADEQRIIQRDRCVRFLQNNEVSSGHKLMAAWREIIRHDLDKHAKIIDTSMRTLVLGATDREFRQYASNPFVYYQLANREGKDMTRMVIAFLDKVRKNKTGKANRKNNTVACKKRADVHIKSIDQMLTMMRNEGKIPARFVLWEESQKLFNEGIQDDDPKMPDDVRNKGYFEHYVDTAKRQCWRIGSGVKDGYEWLLPRWIPDVQDKCTYDQIVFEDVGYNFTAHDWYKIFRGTGAHVAYGYLCLPWELQFPGIVEQPGYRYRVSGKYSLLGYEGPSNGYKHKTDAWSTLLVNTTLNIKDMSLGIEIISRAGPMTCIRIWRMQSNDYNIRRMALPEELRSIQILNVRQSTVNRTGSLVMGDLKYFPVRISDFQDSLNYAIDIAKESLCFRSVMMFIRRRCSGLSLVTKDLAGTWTLDKSLISELAEVVYVIAVARLALYEKFEEHIKSRSFNPCANLFQRMWYKATSHIRGLVTLLEPHSDYERVLVKGVPGEVWQEAEARCARVKEHISQRVFVGENPESMLDQDLNFDETVDDDGNEGCAFCEELVECIGVQDADCDRDRPENYYHQFALSNDELKNFRESLADTLMDPIGLKNTKERALTKVPPAPFSDNARVQYICGPPGTGKSHAIRALATRDDIVIAPFTRLREDYTDFIHPITQEKTSLKFYTQHNAMDAMNHKRIFVDEYTAMPYECLAVVVHRCAASEVILVGDDKQTGLIHGVEGIAIGTKIDIDVIRRHTLRKNFRNPCDTVSVLNTLFGYDMLATNTRYGYLYDSLRNFKNYRDGWTPIFFTHSSAAKQGCAQSSADKVTVRANQGATYNKVLLVACDDDQRLFDMPAMAIVALSRHRRKCVILHEDGPSAVFAQMVKSGVPRGAQNNAHLSDSSSDDDRQNTGKGNGGGDDDGGGGGHGHGHGKPDQSDSDSDDDRGPGRNDRNNDSGGGGGGHRSLGPTDPPNGNNPKNTGGPDNGLGNGGGGHNGQGPTNQQNQENFNNRTSENVLKTPTNPEGENGNKDKTPENNVVINEEVVTPEGEGSNQEQENETVRVPTGGHAEGGTPEVTSVSKGGDDGSDDEMPELEEIPNDGVKRQKGRYVWWSYLVSILIFILDVVVFGMDSIGAAVLKVLRYFFALLVLLLDCCVAVVTYPWTRNRKSVVSRKEVTYEELKNTVDNTRQPTNVTGTTVSKTTGKYTVYGVRPGVIGRAYREEPKVQGEKSVVNRRRKKDRFAFPNNGCLIESVYELGQDDKQTVWARFVAALGSGMQKKLDKDGLSISDLEAYCNFHNVKIHVHYNGEPEGYVVCGKKGDYIGSLNYITPVNGNNHFEVKEKVERPVTKVSRQKRVHGVEVNPPIILSAIPPSALKAPTVEGILPTPPDTSKLPQPVRLMRKQYHVPFVDPNQMTVLTSVSQPTIDTGKRPIIDCARIIHHLVPTTVPNTPEFLEAQQRLLMRTQQTRQMLQGQSSNTNVDVSQAGVQQVEVRQETTPGVSVESTHDATEVQQIGVQQETVPSVPVENESVVAPEGVSVVQEQNGGANVEVPQVETQQDTMFSPPAETQHVVTSEHTSTSQGHSGGTSAEEPQVAIEQNEDQQEVITNVIAHSGHSVTLDGVSVVQEQISGVSIEEPQVEAQQEITLNSRVEAEHVTTQEDSPVSEEQIGRTNTEESQIEAQQAEVPQEVIPGIPTGHENDVTPEDVPILEQISGIGVEESQAEVQRELIPYVEEPQIEVQQGPIPYVPMVTEHGLFSESALVLVHPHSGLPIKNVSFVGPNALSKLTYRVKRDMLKNSQLRKAVPPVGFRKEVPWRLRRFVELGDCGLTQAEAIRTMKDMFDDFSVDTVVVTISLYTTVLRGIDKAYPLRTLVLYHAKLRWHRWYSQNFTQVNRIMDESSDHYSPGKPDSSGDDQRHSKSGRSPGSGKMSKLSKFRNSLRRSSSSSSGSPGHKFTRYLPDWTGGDNKLTRSLPQLDLVEPRKILVEPLANSSERFLEMARLFTNPIRVTDYLVEQRIWPSREQFPLPQTPFDAYRLLIEDFATTREYDLMLTNQDSLFYFDPNFGNGLFDLTRLDNINPRGHPKKNKQMAWSILAVAPGVTYFNNNLSQSLACLQARYLTNLMVTRFTYESVRKATEMADLFFFEHMYENFDVFNEQDIWMTTMESEHAMKVKNYEAQVMFDVGGETDVRFTMKDIFKPIKSKIDPFKAGQGISAWSKDSQTIFQTAFRVINKHFINCLLPHVVYDNGIDEITLMNRVNALFSQLPSTAMNGVIDATACDSGQNRFTQQIERRILERLGINDYFLDWYYSFREQYVLKGYGVTAKIKDIKTSGEPATLLNNTILMAVLMNYLIRGEGPCVLVIKGDDGLKRQANIVYDEQLKVGLKAYLKMEFKVDIDVPITFCGYFLFKSYLVPDLVRKIFKLLGHRFRDYQHFSEYRESLLDWILNVNKIGLNDVCSLAATAYDSSPEYCEHLFYGLVSISHLKRAQFESFFTLREFDWGEDFGAGEVWSLKAPWYKGSN